MNKKIIVASAILCACLAVLLVVFCLVPGNHKEDDQLLAQQEETMTETVSEETQQPTEPAEKSEPMGETNPTEPAEPDPAEPKPVNPKPTEPKPTDPKPTEPTPTEPATTEPAPTEPEPTQPEQDDRVTVLTGEVSSEDDVVTEDVSMGDGDVSAEIPAGVQLEEDTSTLTLTITEKDSSDSGVDLENGQVIKPLDVHMEGVSTENTQPITICLGKILPNGLNIGNVTLYHVEAGSANVMSQIMDLDELDAHNEFYYDPATGDITVAMATFSEVAAVSDTQMPWEGNIAEAFSGGSGTEEDPYIIANADQLAYMSKAVSEDESEEGIYTDAYYKLISDINLSGEEARANDSKKLVFYPIGYWAEQEGSNGYDDKWYGAGNSFTGTFDGNGNTISNIYQNTWLMDGNYDAGYWKTAMGLFGALYNATIKNLTVDNFQSDGEYTPTGCIAAYAGGPEMLFENISLTNCNPRVYNTGNGGLVGLNYNSSSEGSYDHITFRNITVDQTNKISALWGSYDVSCGGILGRLRENTKHDGTNTAGQKNTVTFENCHVAAIMDVNNDCCANYQYYQYRYSGMLIGTVDYIGDVPNVGVADVVSAENTTVTYGDWNEYWYCELVKNSLASYTHDHQFSRLTEISDLSDIQDENGNWNTEGNFVLPNEDNTAAACYHIFKNADGELYQHFHDAEDESNPDIYESKDINGDGKLEDLKEDRQRYYIPFGQLWTGYGWGSSPMYAFEGVTVADGGTVKSEPKFEAEDVTTVTEKTKIRLDSLVRLIVDETKLSKSTLSVFVSPVGEDSTVSAAIVMDTNEWGNSTLTFSGTGMAKIVITDYYYCTETVLYICVLGEGNAALIETPIEGVDPVGKP